MKIESIACDYCDSVFKLNDEKFFTIEGVFKFGKHEFNSLQTQEKVLHICFNCFAKKLNLNDISKNENLPTYGLGKRNHCNGIIGQGDMY